MSTNPYQIWLEKNGQKLLLPVNPEKINIGQNGNNQSVTVAELGEAVILQKPKALTLSFSSFLPSAYVQGGHYGRQVALSEIGDYNGDGAVNVRDLAVWSQNNSSSLTVSNNAMTVMPQFCINFMLDAMTSKQPVRVTVTKCSFSHIMSVESFSYSQSGGDVGAYQYSVSFKIYRDIKMRQVTVKNGKATAPKNTAARTGATVRPKTYTARSGDTLFTIAKKQYGDSSKYMIIYNANKKIIGANINHVRPGMVLTLP